MYPLSNRIFRFAFVVFSFCLAATSSAQQVSFQQVLDRATATPDEIMRYGDAEPQFSELYLPKHTAQNTLPSDVEKKSTGTAYRTTQAKLKSSAAAKLLVVFLHGGGWPGTMNDIESAINALTKHDAVAYDTHNIILVGHSAGGHLALLASQPKRGLPIRAVVGLAAITDIAAYAAGESSCEQSAARFIDTSPSDVEAMNPVASERHAEVILLRGESDTIVGREQLQLDNAQVIHIAEAGHFDVIHPDTPAFSLVLRVLQHLHSEHTPIVSEE